MRRRESEEVYSGTPEESLAYQGHRGHKAVAVRSEGVMEHNDGFTIAGSMFPY